MPPRPKRVQGLFGPTPARPPKGVRIVYSEGRNKDPGPRPNYMEDGEGVEWWAAISQNAARFIRRLLRDQDAPGELYTRMGSIMDLGKTESGDRVVALQLTDPEGDVAKDWVLDVALEDVGIQLVTPLHRITGGRFNPLDNHGHMANHQVVRSVQEKLMPIAPVKKPAAAPAKPAVAASPAPKAAPAQAAKPAPAAPKAAPAPAPKAAPAAPAAKPAPAAPGKPAAPAAAPKAAPAAPSASLADLEARLAKIEKQFEDGDLAQVITDHSTRIGTLEAMLAYGDGASRDADGKIVLRLEDQPSEALRSWAYIFHSEELAVDTLETIKATLEAQMGSAEGLVAVNDGTPIPDSVNAIILSEEGGEAPPEEQAEEGEATISYTAEELDAMDSTKLKAAATALGVDFSDMAKRIAPAVLRERIKDFIAQTAAPEEGALEDLPADTAVLVDIEGQAYEGTIVSGPDAEGDYVVRWSDGSEASCNTTTISLPLYGAVASDRGVRIGSHMAPFLRLESVCARDQSTFGQSTACPSSPGRGRPTRLIPLSGCGRPPCTSLWRGPSRSMGSRTSLATLTTFFGETGSATYTSTSPMSDLKDLRTGTR